MKGSPDGFTSTLTWSSGVLRAGPCGPDAAITADSPTFQLCTGGPPSAIQTNGPFRTGLSTRVGPALDCGGRDAARARHTGRGSAHGIRTTMTWGKSRCNGADPEDLISRGRRRTPGRGKPKASRAWPRPGGACYREKGDPGLARRSAWGVAYTALRTAQLSCARYAVVGLMRHALRCGDRHLHVVKVIALARFGVTERRPTAAPLASPE